MKNEEFVKETCPTFLFAQATIASEARRDGKQKSILQHERRQMLKDTKDGVLLPIKVIPRASKHSIAGWENGELKIRLNAIPEKGEANQELIAFLAKIWKISKSSFSIDSGETSRHKKLLIRGLKSEKLIALIALHTKAT